MALMRQRLETELRASLGDPEMLDAALRVAAATVDLLDQPHLAEDDVKRRALATLGSELDGAETALAAAEQRVHGGR